MAGSDCLLRRAGHSVATEEGGRACGPANNSFSIFSAMFLFSRTRNPNGEGATHSVADRRKVVSPSGVRSWLAATPAATPRRGGPLDARAGYPARLPSHLSTRLSSLPVQSATTGIHSRVMVIQRFSSVLLSCEVWKSGFGQVLIKSLPDRCKGWTTTHPWRRRRENST
jgi:hypothetical protein